MALQDLANRMALTTTRLARLLRQQDQGELTLTFRAALATIERRGALTLGELAHAEHFAPPTVTKVVNKLADQGLVERTIDINDKRVCRVSITAAGAELLAADRRRRAAWLAGRLAQLTADERGRLAEALDVIESLTEAELQRA
jgi:DNA-binding MarR family transcriptional regulator